MRRLALGALAVAGTLALAAPAYADVSPAEPWLVLDTAADGTQTDAAHSQIIDGTTVDLTWTTVGVGGGTSLETTDLGVDVTTGDVVAVHYELKDGASPAAGAVRLFIYDHADGDTVSEAPAQFAFAPAEGTGGTLEIAVDFTGTIGTAGLVYDTSNGGVPGTVRFTDLTVDGETVLFVEPEPEPSESPSEEPSTEPSSAAPSTTPPAGSLPITGAPLAGLAIGGVVLLGAGTGLMLARRRRRFVA